MKLFSMLICLVVLTGCVHTSSVDLSRDAQPSFAEINRLGAKKQASVMLADGRALHVKNLQIAPDAASWFDAETGRFETVATAEIRQIQFLRHGKGASEGFALGLLTGIVTGSVLGFASGDDEPCHEGWFFCWSLTAEEKAVLGAVAFGSVGSVVGLPLGAMVGSKSTYHFTPPPPKTPVVAGGSQ